MNLNPSMALCQLGDLEEEPFLWALSSLSVVGAVLSAASWGGDEQGLR